MSAYNRIYLYICYYEDYTSSQLSRYYDVWRASDEYYTSDKDLSNQGAPSCQDTLPSYSRSLQERSWPSGPLGRPCNSIHLDGGGDRLLLSQPRS